MIGLIQNKTIYEYDIRSLILAFMLGEKIELTDHVDSIYDFILDVDYKDQEIVMNLYKKKMRSSYLVIMKIRRFLKTG